MEEIGEATEHSEKATTTHSWNYTLPNLFEYLDSLLASQAARNKSDSEILRNLNSSFFIFGNLSDPSSGSLENNPSQSTSTQPVNKPVFTLNLSFRSTMTSFVGGFPQKLNGSEFQLLNGYQSPPEERMDMEAPSSTNLLLDVNETFVSLDNSWWLASNGSANFTGTGTNKTDNEALRELVSMVITSTVLGIMILTTVIGNVFVIAAILLERNLQQVANFLIVSLAVADLMVACLVMPLGAVYEISNEWALGPELCDMWTSSDVLCCTASILHLVAIALDRYWAVTHIDYIHSRNGKRIGTMIFFVWMTAFVVSIAPLFGWKDPDFSFRVTEQKKCLVSQDLTYQIFATMSTFYVPLTAILILYWKIFQTARKRIHKRPGRNEIAQQMLKKVKSSKRACKSNGLPQKKKKQQPQPQPQPENELTTTAFTTEASGNMGMPSERSSNNGAVSICTETSLEGSKNEICSPKDPNSPHSVHIPQSVHHKKTKKESLEAKREKKAAKTLAIITGAFVVCWLPFFVTILTMTICPTCWMSDLMFSIFLWLGYFNSTLNPIIYTIFSPEFRQAFKRILCGRKHQRYRPGKIH